MRHIRREIFEPGVALAQQLAVGRAVNIVLQGLDSFPNGHVQNQPVVVVGPQIGGIALRRLQPPDEAGSVVGEGVNFVQPADESDITGPSRGPLMRPIFTCAI